MLEIRNSSSCTGCAACYNICPVQAVTMCSDEEGFLRPCINNDICIKCGKCEKVCPILYPTITPESIKEAYACFALDENIRKSSSSGGVFTLLAQEVIRRKGVVFGAMFAEDFSVIHSWTDTDDFRHEAAVVEHWWACDVGVMLFSRGEVSVMSVLRRAGQAMYVAKNSRKITFKVVYFFKM